MNTEATLPALLSVRYDLQVRRKPAGACPCQVLPVSGSCVLGMLQPPRRVIPSAKPDVSGGPD